MLANGIVPVLHGDVAMDSSKGIDVLSGDQLIEYMAKALGARKAGIGTNVDGVYAKDFKYIREITPATVSDVRDALAGSGGVDVTGGMYGKVMELLTLANAGVPSLVFNAGTPGNVTKFLKGEEITGTMIHGD
jgi:isopentenyl phosphate kinase